MLEQYYEALYQGPVLDTGEVITVSQDNYLSRWPSMLNLYPNGIQYSVISMLLW